MAFQCPKCTTKMKTQDSRKSDMFDFPATRRRNVCDKCGHAVTTYEMTAENYQRTAKLATGLKELKELKKKLPDLLDAIEFIKDMRGE